MERDTQPSAGPARLLTCLMFFTFAMTTDAIGSVIPRVMDETGLSMTAASALQSATMLGIAGGALFLGFLADRVGRQRTIILGLSLYGLSSLLVAIGGSYAGLISLLALAGLGISVFKTAALALIGDITPNPREHTRFMNTVEGWFAVGAIAGPAIVAALLSRGASWRGLYVVAAMICLALVLMAARMPTPAPRASIERASLLRMLGILRDPLALVFSLLIALYVAVEVAIYTWMPTYLKSYAGGQAWWPAWALTAFFILRAAGRFLGAWLLDRVQWTTALAIL
ncbi:MAG: hypothetical protein RLZZ393_1311, partial [Pseudomonadota bacterium]